MSKPSLEDRVSVLETAIGSALGVNLAEYDPAAIQAKREAEAKAFEEAERAAADAKAKADARAAAEREAAERQEREIAARAQAILEKAKAKK